MDKLSYERFRDEAIKRLTDELRLLFDQFYAKASKNNRRSAKRLNGLKLITQSALERLVADGQEVFSIQDVIQEIERQDHQTAKAIKADPGKKASLSKLLIRLGKQAEMFRVDKAGEGRRATQYKFTDLMLERFREPESIEEPQPRFSEWYGDTFRQ